MYKLMVLLFAFLAVHNSFSAEQPSYDYMCESQTTNFRYRVYSTSERSFIQILVNHDENFGLMDELVPGVSDTQNSHPGYFLILSLSDGREAAALFINTSSGEVNGSITNHISGVTSGVNCSLNTEDHDFFN